MRSPKTLSSGLAPAGFVCLLTVLGAGNVAKANVYAAHLTAPDGWNPETMGPLTLLYRLNEPATSVTIEIFRDSAPGTVIKTISGTTNYGLNSVQWDGTADGGGPAPAASDYKFRVIANDTAGHGAWENITPTDGPNEIGSAQYAAPQGVAINRDEDSEFFGRIYVLSGESSVTSGNPGATAVGDGVFMLNNDMTFLQGTASSAAAPANAALESDILSITSPWRLQINHDNSDELVIGDWSDGFEDVWIFNADGTTASRILDRTTSGPGTGGSQNHGNAVGAMLSGTGANRRLWIIDDDYDLNGDIYLTGPDISVFDIGATSEDYTGQPNEVINGGRFVSGAAGSNWTARGFYRGAISGDLYVANQRFIAGDELAVSRYVLDANGKATSAAWSLSNYDVTYDPVVSTALGIQWTETYAVAVDDVHDIGAAGRTGGGEVIIFNTNGAILAAFDSGGDQVRDLDFDAAGNLYTTNETDNHVRMWSPPTDSNGFTTTYVSVMNIGPDASPDCNGNSVPDETDIVGGTSQDCNTNGIPDECDIVSSFSQDLNANGIPDECDVPPPVIFAAPAAGDVSVAVTFIDPQASLVKVLVDGTTNGTVSPAGETTVDVTVPALSMGQIVTARTIVNEFESDESALEIVTTNSITATLICDDFEYADQAAFDAVWEAETNGTPSLQLLLSTAQNSTIGGQKSAQALSSDRYRSKITGLTGILPTSTHPLVWSVNVYDETAGVDVDQWADLNADVSQDFFLAQAGIASPYFTGTGEPETHYQTRLIGNGGPDWLHLNQFDGPTRSVGWHRFSVVFKGRRSGETKGHYVDIYVDGRLAAKNKHINEDTVLEVPRIGSGEDSIAGSFFDEYCAQVGPVGELTFARDCNANSVPDLLDIAGATSQDLNDNEVPDECDPDCNTNGMPDDMDISFGTSQDCNTNGIPDACDISSSLSQDCNLNGTPDSCDLAFGDSSDCNANDIPDTCDLSLGTSSDCDANGYPDVCDLHPGGEVAKLLASDATEFQEFGQAIAVDGEFAVIGVPRSGVGGTAYVFRRVGTTWSEQQRLAATDPQAFDQFGRSVAISGNRILVGANGDDDGGGSSGSAYVFRRDGTTWVQEAKLTAGDASGGDQFGYSVAMNGQYAVIGAYLDDTAASNAGSAYVFLRSNETWIEKQEIVSSDIAPGDLFGWAASISGDHAVIGAMRDDDAGDDSGSAYVFVNSNGTWVQQAKLTADDGAEGDLFAYSVSISGQSAVIGAYGQDGGGFDSGAAYAFFNSNGTWGQEAKILGADTGSFDTFGVSMAVSGDYAVMGARGDDDAGASSGAAYLFRRNAGNWIQQEKLTAADAESGDQLGSTVAIDGYDVFVAARGDDDAGSFSGAVYLFRVPVLDCNSNGTLDTCDIAGATSPDCNNNFTPDACDIGQQSSPDCNSNSIPDECDIVAGTGEDCNTNGILDLCDLAQGTSQDCNDTGRPDVCETIGNSDFDGDGDVDLTDFAHLVDCSPGPDETPDPPAPICPQTCLDAFDADPDDDVDLYDFAAFQDAFTG